MKNLLYAAMTGAALWIITEIIEMGSSDGSTTFSLWLTTLWHPILALGFWGLHKVQSEQKNTLSQVAVLMIILSLLAFAPVSLMILNGPEVTFSEFMREHPVYQVFGLVSIIGYVLFSISILRTRFYPSWMGFGLLLSILLAMVQTFGQLAEVIQHVAFIATSIVVINLSLFGIWSINNQD